MAKVWNCMQKRGGDLHHPPTFAYSPTLLPLFRICQIMKSCIFDECFTLWPLLPGVLLTNPPQLLHTVRHFCNFSQLFGYSYPFLSFLMPPEPCQALQSLPELLEPFGAFPNTPEPPRHRGSPSDSPPHCCTGYGMGGWGCSVRPSAAHVGA